jgi:hypothetical protein
LTASSACGVAITPGAIALTVIWSGPSSSARLRTMPWMPAFAVV